MFEPSLVGVRAAAALLLAVPACRPLAAQSLVAVELAEDIESVCGRIRLHSENSPAIDNAWAKKDGKTLLALAGARLTAKPFEYQGHALEYLTILEIQKDRENATVRARKALRQLNKHPLALANFVRYAVLSQPTAADYQFARMALAAVVPDHRNNAAVRITHVAALLGAGRTKEAILTNKTIVEDLAKDLDGLLELTNTICDSEHGRSLAAIATLALEKVIAARGTTVPTSLARFRLLHDLTGRQAEAAPVAAGILAKIKPEDLNDWIWDLMALRANAGRYHSLALLASEQLAKTTDLGSHEYDTMALAWFCNGHIDRAIELQTRSLQLGGGDQPDYRRRMAHYEAARSARAKSKQGPAKSGK